MSSTEDEVVCTSVTEDPRKAAEYHKQRADAAVMVKQEARNAAHEAREDEADARENVQQMYVMQDAERHQFEYLVRLVQQSINEQRVISQDELDKVTNMRWQDAAAANRHVQVEAPAAPARATAAPAAAVAAAAAAPLHTAAPAAAALMQGTAPAAPAQLPANPPSHLQEEFRSSSTPIKQPSTRQALS